MKKLFLLLCSLFMALAVNAQTPGDTTGVVIGLKVKDIDPEIDNPHKGPISVPAAVLYDHTLYIYAEAEKQVSIFPVDYDDETNPLYTTVVPELPYSSGLPSWLEGVYAIEIEINGIVFVGEIEL